MKKHKCEEFMRFCSCNMLGLEPSETCEVHGGNPVVPRCRCGKFVKVVASRKGGRKARRVEE